MKRRKLKKQIPLLAHKLSPVVSKYLSANDRVHHDVIYNYQNEIELAVVELMRVYLTLDPTWPHRERWLDGLGEDYSWSKKSGVLYGTGELFWGHWPDVSSEIIGVGFNVALRLCPRHGVEYKFKSDEDYKVRNYSSRWCTADLLNA